jgi:hypothetical protein
MALISSWPPVSLALGDWYKSLKADSDGKNFSLLWQISGGKMWVCTSMIIDLHPVALTNFKSMVRWI